MLTASRPARYLPRALVAAVVLALAASMLLVSPADAGRRKIPKKVTNVTVVAKSTTSFTVTATKAKYAKKYQLVASANKKHMMNRGIHPDYFSHKSRTPQVTLRGLKESATPYYYRVVSLRGKKVHYSPLYSVNLPPATPTGLSAAAAPAGLALTWKVGNADSFDVRAATDPAFADGGRSYQVQGRAGQFTPYGLTAGTTYYFQVRARSGSAVSAYSATAAAVAPATGQPVRLLSYNLLSESSDGMKAGDGVVAPWRDRLKAATDLIEQARPDVLAVQEGNKMVDWPARQVDTLVSRLGSPWQLADTEVPPTDPSYQVGGATGPYLVYRSDKFRAVGAGGNWELPGKWHAAYQELTSTSSGASFLAVSVHLMAGNGLAKDQTRRDEANALVSRAEAYAGARGLPIVYAGDFNSHGGSGHVFDGPGLVMAGQSVADALDVTPEAANSRFNSANQYYRTPPARGLNIDHIFAGPGVAVTGWEMLLRVNGGQFVGTIPSDHNPLVADLVIPS